MACPSAAPPNPRRALLGALAAVALLSSHPARAERVDEAVLNGGSRTADLSGELADGSSAATEVDALRQVTHRVELVLGLCPTALRSDRAMGDRTALCLDRAPVGRMARCEVRPFGCRRQLAPPPCALRVAPLAVLLPCPLISRRFWASTETRLPGPCQISSPWLSLVTWWKRRSSASSPASGSKPEDRGATDWGGCSRVPECLRPTPT